MHMSVPDYRSLGDTVMQVMHNYLPSEQSKLQFISGKILDVFYDEFIKFIPPYILKREEEKRKRMEQGNRKDNQVIQANNPNKKAQERSNNPAGAQLSMLPQNNRKKSVHHAFGKHGGTGLEQCS